MKYVSFEIVFGMVHGWPYGGFQNIPPHTSSNLSSLEKVAFYISLHVICKR
jgi:hypothetical protein